MNTWPHLRGFSEVFSSSNLEFNNKRVILQELKQFHMIVQNQKCNSSNLHNLRAFHMTVQDFPMIMWNRNIKFLSFLLSFIPFPSSFFTSTTSKSTQIPVQTYCITSFIMHLDHYQIICSLQFSSSLLSPIYQIYTLKLLQNFIKLVSNSCKGNNMLIECFRHNYYSEDVKLMRIII